MKDEPYESVRRAIERYDSAIVLGHQYPDGDAIGSTLGLGIMLEHIGKQVSVSWPEPFELPEKYGFLPGRHLMVAPGALEGEKLVMALDCANLDRLEELSDVAVRASTLVNIDHHTDNTEFGTVNLVDPAASATAEIIYLAAREMGMKIGVDEATCLYTGLVTDTGRFQFNNTTATTFRVASGLVEKGVRPNMIFEKVFQSDSLEYDRLWGEVMKGASFDPRLKLIFAFLSQEELTRWGVHMNETEDLIDNLRAVEGHRIAALFKERANGKIRVSLRSKADIDIGSIARRLGGGGHPTAAGYTSIQQGFDAALEELKGEIARGRGSGS